MTKPDPASASCFAGAWYVAHTKPRQEELAQQNLLRQGYGVYLPKLKVLRYMQRGARIGFDALFPRYLFFRPADSNHSIAPVRSTFGIASVVRFGAVLAQIRPHVLERIRAFERERDTAGLAELSGLKSGEAIVVNSGPLAGLHGLVEMVSKERVIVLMRLLGEETRVTLRLGELRVAA